MSQSVDIKQKISRLVLKSIRVYTKYSEFRISSVGYGSKVYGGFASFNSCSVCTDSSFSKWTFKRHFAEINLLTMTLISSNLVVRMRDLSTVDHGFELRKEFGEDRKDIQPQLHPRYISKRSVGPRRKNPVFHRVSGL